MNAPDKLFSSRQIREADAYTIQHEPIPSVELMERAANACFQWLRVQSWMQLTVRVFCGLGNNGGDGLAIARLLHEAGYKVSIYIIRYSAKCSEDFRVNEQRLTTLKNIHTVNIHEGDCFPEIHDTDLVIDALFGTGLSKAVTGLAAGMIKHINDSSARIISIDIASGLFADTHSDADSVIIKPAHTLSFQFMKLAFLFAENAKFIGELKILDIGLHKSFIEKEPVSNYMLNRQFIKQFLKPRLKFSHKGSFGHALLIAGSYGKIGAAVLSCKALLRSGAGLLTVNIPACGYEVLQGSTPEAMAITDQHAHCITESVVSENYSAIGIGPGIGIAKETQQALRTILIAYKKPLVLDADALNCISLNPELISFIPNNSILTPHLKEFERLAGTATDDFDRNLLQIEFSKTHKVYIVLKGAYTCISTPEGICYFNSTGNPGMAKGGSGDVLTGIITGLLAQGHSPLHSAIIGVYAHGLAGDKAKEKKGETGMTASDLIDAIPEAFLILQSYT